MKSKSIISTVLILTGCVFLLSGCSKKQSVSTIEEASAPQQGVASTQESETPQQAPADNGMNEIESKYAAFLSESGETNLMSQGVLFIDVDGDGDVECFCGLKEPLITFMYIDGEGNVKRRDGVAYYQEGGGGLVFTDENGDWWFTFLASDNLCASYHLEAAKETAEDGSEVIKYYYNFEDIGYREEITYEQYQEYCQEMETDYKKVATSFLEWLQ